MSRTRVFALILALALIVLAWQQVLAARAGLVQRSLRLEGGAPALFVAPAAAEAAPLVLIAHGFAGSKQLMLGYAYTLAQAGYATISWDFRGHGANAMRMAGRDLQADVDAAFAALAEQPGTDRDRVAILGHSMGSGAAMNAGLHDRDRYSAVIAISPTGAAVTPTRPRNLMLQAGSLEGGFVENAQALLAAAGGENADFGSDLARIFVLIPNAEHISILFRPVSQAAALDWLDGVFGQQRASDYVDRRIIWYGVHLLAWLLLLWAVSPRLRSEKGAGAEKRSSKRQWLGLSAGALAGTAALAGLNAVLGSVSELGGILVGGAVAAYFAAAGAVWLGISRETRRRGEERGAGREGRGDAGRVVLLGLGLFVLLWLAFGALAQAVWLQWLLIPARLLRWPLLALGVFPWFLAAGLAQQGESRRRRWLWWLAQSVFVVIALFLAVILVPGLFFLMLLMPLIPIIFGILTFAGSQIERPWAVALGSALFFGWVLAAVFPLAG